MRVRDQQFYDQFEEHDAEKIYWDSWGEVLRRVMEERIPPIFQIGKNEKEEEK